MTSDAELIQLTAKITNDVLDVAEKAPLLFPHQVESKLIYKSGGLTDNQLTMLQRNMERLARESQPIRKIAVHADTEGHYRLNVIVTLRNPLVT